MPQQTAVEWLIEQLIKTDKELDGRRKNEDTTILKLNPTKLFEQAKEMEKERLEDCWIAAHQAGRFEGKGIAEENWQTFFNYYNETYNK